MTDDPTRRDVCVWSAALAAGVTLPSLPVHGQEQTTPAPAAVEIPPVLTFRGDAARAYQGSGPVPRSPVVRWSFEIGTHVEALTGGKKREWKGTGWSGQAALAEGRVYVPGLDGTCYCRDADTGDPVWQTQVGDSIKGSITLWDQRVLFGSRDNHLHCLAREDGGELWKLACGGKDVDSTPAAVGARAYFGAEDTHLYCINAAGQVLWSHRTGGSIESSPAVVDGRVYVGSYDGYLHCVRADDGTPLWRFPTGDDTDSSPVVVGDAVYVGSENGFLYAVDRLTGERIWRYRAGAGIWGTPAVADGRVFVGADDAMVHCVGADDGRPRWRGDVAAGMWASPTVVDGLVLIGDWNGVLNALDARTGEGVWTVETGSYIVSTACVAGGRIYIGSRNGTFYCFEDAGEEAP